MFYKSFIFPKMQILVRMLQIRRFLRVCKMSNIVYVAILGVFYEIQYNFTLFKLFESDSGGKLHGRLNYEKLTQYFHYMY